MSLLLVEDNDADADMITRRLEEARLLRFGVERCAWLSSTTTVLANRQFDVILLDLSLPDSHGIETVMEIMKVAPNTPVIVLSGREDIEVSVLAVRAGAQDFLVKKIGLSTDMIERTVLYAIQRARNEVNAKQLYMGTRSELASPTKESIPPSSPKAEMVEPHIAVLEDYLVREMLHLQRNSPTNAEAIHQIRESLRVRLALRELRSILKLDEEGRSRSTKTTQPISQRALRAVREASRGDEEDIQTKAEADAAILGALKGPAPVEYTDG
ncbi:MAG: response regulator [Mycobacterium sp.]